MTTELAHKPRDLALDRLRGLAIVLMILDHILDVTHFAFPLRLTVTRLALPLFFLLSGHLIRRLDTKRLVIIAAIGSVLPLLVPWIDKPNVLLFYAILAPIVYLCGQFPIVRLPILAFSMTMYANSFGLIHAAYSPFALLGLMLIGQMMPREFLHWKLPRFLELPGRIPLQVYVGHLLFLEGILLIGNAL